MNTQIWGPLFWQTFNDVAVVADELCPKLRTCDQKKFQQFFILFRDVLPCKYCRESFTKFTSEEPPAYPFIDWVHAVHNKVNLKLKRPLTLDLAVFKRRCQVYTSFGGTNRLWDMLFVLAMNNDASKPKVYSQLFAHLKWLYPALVKYRHYDSSMAKLLLDYNASHIRDKTSMITWLLKHYPVKTTYKDLVLRFGHAVAYKTIEEYAQVCGDLLIKSM